MLTWHGCDNLSLHGFMEPAVVDSNPTIFRGVEDVGVALPETNLGMVVGFSGVDGLRRNDIVSRHHHHERNLGCGEAIRVEPVERASLIEHMVERPAQRERGVLASHQWQLMKPSKRLALPAHFLLEQPKSGGGIADDVVTLVGEANHQGRLALMT